MGVQPKEGFLALWADLFSLPSLLQSLLGEILEVIPPLPVLAVLEMIPKALKVLATEGAFPLNSCNSLFCTGDKAPIPHTDLGGFFPKSQLPECQLPRSQLPECQLPRSQLPECQLPKMLTPKMSTPKIYILTKYTIYLSYSYSLSYNLSDCSTNRQF